MLSSPVRYIRPGRRTGEGYIQFDAEEWTLEALKCLTEPKVKETLKFDIWYPPSLASNEAPLPPNPQPNPQESTGYPKVDQQDISIQQLFIGLLPNWLPEHELHDRLLRMFEPFGEIKWLKIGWVFFYYYVVHASLSDKISRLWAQRSRCYRSILPHRIC